MPPATTHRRLLIVEADRVYRDVLLRMAGRDAGVETAIDFQTAYSRLSPVPPDLLITNLRLHSTVEGLQLAYVVASAGSPTRTIVYSGKADPWVTRELQRVGAFFELQERLPFALPAYVQARLPVLDRRDPTRFDRRTKYRGGRRAADVPPMFSWGGGGVL